MLIGYMLSLAKKGNKLRDTCRYIYSIVKGDVHVVNTVLMRKVKSVVLRNLSANIVAVLVYSAFLKNSVLYAYGSYPYRPARISNRYTLRDTLL